MTYSKTLIRKTVTVALSATIGLSSLGFIGADVGHAADATEAYDEYQWQYQDQYEDQYQDRDQDQNQSQDSSQEQSDDQSQEQSVSANSVGTSIINTGKKYLGVKYKFGAKSGITSAFDCSSFMQYIFKQHGIELPRSSKQQSKVGKYVSKSNLRVGDLIFFDSVKSRPGIDHVAVYAGNGQILHTYGKPGVTFSKLSAWEKKIVTIRRVIN
ncbi:C40 family peptidase [Paenibacillus sp. MSJ-34]|uniref:C40 family peptidase n=1 Tax=Paenibacillus sp. MSJ-34 TaxID=2841529 RepID=UPI001C0FE5F9|nr:C40 family peptidase [Paenibacillus sp. MSJ-34]MBU5443174.1 C40 family peptidase [Paenibacillus sp. MSJ-34]